MTIDPSAYHADPIGEAFAHSSQKAAQFVSMVGAAYEIAARRRAIRAARDASRTEQQLRAVQEQERVARAEVRARWAPAFDARWSAQADLVQAGRVWGAAAPYADTDQEAASALRKAEERLRLLHPFAMGRYDRLRADGASPLEAMRETVNLFASEPHARPGEPAAARPLIEAGVPGAGSWPDAGEDASVTASQPGPGATAYQDAEPRGRLIAERLQDRALAERGSRLSPDELVTALEVSTNLPSEVIARLGTNGVTAAQRDMVTTETAGAHAPAARLAAESFPCTTADGIRAAVNGQLQQSAQSPARTAAAQNARRGGLAS